MTREFITGESASDLSKCATAAGIAASHLLDAMGAQLPQEHRDLLATYLEQGGRIGVEILVSGEGKRTFRLVGFDRDEERRAFLELVLAGA